MLQNNTKLKTVDSKGFSMKLWDNPHVPGFRFQQYQSLGENETSPYEALADLKYDDGSHLPNDLFFDPLRDMDEASQIAVDNFLVPLAIQAAQAEGYLPVAVNVHLATLVDEDFIKSVHKQLNRLGLNRKDVLFEIVEPHVPTKIQLEKLEEISVRTSPKDGFVLIIDDHNFETGAERLYSLAPYCDLVKIDFENRKLGIDFLQANFTHLGIVLERVAVEDRQATLRLYKGVSVQGI